MSTPSSTPNEVDDVVLMQHIARDDSAAFECLARRHKTPLLNFFVRMGVYTHQAEDLVQETLLRLWNYRKKYKPTAKFTTFLYTLARHAMLDTIRKEKRFRLFAERYQQEIPQHTDGGMAYSRKQLDIQAALDALPEKQRTVLVLAIYQGLPYEEIADILNIPLGTVKSRIFNALTQIKKVFHEKP